MYQELHGSPDFPLVKGGEFIMEGYSFSGATGSWKELVTKLQPDWDKYWQRNAV